MSMNKINTVAVVMAHPDDEVLGCGGSLARLSRSGASVHVFILATGLTSRGPADKAALLALKDQARAATAKLGGKTIEFADFPDNAMDSLPLLKIVKQVESFVTKIKPDLIFTHHSSDINNDHDLTQRAVRMLRARFLIANL